MLPAQRRIKRDEFPRILKNGTRFHSPHFIAYIVKTGSDTPSRFSFSISKKIAPGAVVRNKYRRQGYAVVQHLPEIPHGYICFFSYKKATYPVKFADIKKEVESLLHNIV